MKACPYCAEEDLQDEAVVCKHCKRDLRPQVKDSSDGCLRWVFTFAVVICSFIGFFWWPAWIFAVIMLLVMITDKKH